MRHGLDERKAKLFQQKPFIPGRKAKYFFTFCILGMAWGSLRSQRRQEDARKSSHRTGQILRRLVPFVQAMEDVRICAIHERNYLMLQSICASDPAVFEELRRRYNQEDL